VTSRLSLFWCECVASSHSVAADHDVAFHLFLGPRPRPFGSFAFLNTPHVGIYDHDDYTPALPIVLVSVPLPDPDRQLPASVAEVLEVCRSNAIISAEPELYFMIHSGLEGVGVRECGERRFP